jgi:hypothetical protein
MFKKLARFKCVHCPARFTTRRERILHEALECPNRPSTKK